MRRRKNVRRRRKKRVVRQCRVKKHGLTIDWSIELKVRLTGKYRSTGTPALGFSLPLFRLPRLGLTN